MEETGELRERVILVGVQTDPGEDTEDSIQELDELVQTAGAETVGAVIQRRESVHPATYIGKGKLDELRELLCETEADGIICDDELSPAQMNHLQRELECKVMDRTLLILDIFAKHASTSEGKLQVELAQLRYRAARLTGLGNSLSRLGGGIGTRGPGEKKLETDRRLIRVKISRLKRQLEEVVQRRGLIRAQRERNGQPIVALTGYTSVGKSAIFKKLTGADVLEDAKLFATLDTTTRALSLPGGQQVLLTDTVGFIRKLPANLIEAFKSTLEEVCCADIIIHVVDASSPQMAAQMQVVYETLQELGAGDKPVITVFNKMDLLTEHGAGRELSVQRGAALAGPGTDTAPDPGAVPVAGLRPAIAGNTGLDERPSLRDFRAEKSIRASARLGEGMEDIVLAVEEILRSRKIYIERLYSYDQAGLIQKIRRKGELLEEDYRPEGIFVRAYVPREIYMSV